MRGVLCPLCGSRKARRDCPAVGQRICPVCCGTKRLKELACPPGCVYLAAAREHPASAEIKRQQQDTAVLAGLLRDLAQQQAGLALAAASTIRRHQSAPLQPLLDSDVKEALGALAATFETAERGVIYEHRPGSRPAERLAGDLKAFLEQAGARGGSAFGRDAALVLRRLEAAVGEAGAPSPGNPHAFLDFLARVVPAEVPGSAEDAGDKGASGEPSRRAGSGPRLIVP